jgi:cation:H+ antiporter
MSWNGRIGYLDGTTLLIAYVVLAAFIATHRATRRTDSTRTALEAVGSTRNSALLLVLRLVLGLALLVYGADLVVFHATHLARAWGMSDLFVGLTVVAIATSLPQLAMALRAAAANRGDEVVLGVLGSNLINLTLILGVTALLSPLEVPASLVRLEIPAVIAFGLVLYPMLRGDFHIRRAEGAILVAAFGALMAFQFLLVRA